MRKNLIIPGLTLLTAVLLAGCQDQLAPPTGPAGSSTMDVTEPGAAPAGFQPLADVSPQQTDGLQTMVTETGMVSASVDGVGTINPSGTVQIDKPAGATVRSAYFAAASRGLSGIQLMNGEVQIDGAPINWDASVAGPINNWNHWAEVTEHVREKLDAAPAGLVEFTISQNRPTASEGLILGVIFNDPNRDAENTVVFLFGRQRTTGDEFLVNLANPIDKDDPNLRLTMGLGISFGFQPSQQVSIVEVNGERLSSSAGGQDDTQGTVANGSLLTVGGVGDSPDNPPPFAGATDPRIDDELYNLVPFVDDGDTQIRVFTRNPSNDDNIYFAWFDISEVGGVDCIPVTIDRIWSSGTENGTVSLSSFETFAAIFNVETFLPRPASPNDVRLADGAVDETSFDDGTPAQRFFLTDLNTDGIRDVVVVFRTQRLIDEDNLSEDTERITLWGRDPNTNSLFCATTTVDVVP
ncbi:MAG: hypothetical protein H0U67_12805 [Gemmatimonadetes bacterium]|nr:hypothetical protein [Gemmatimonadota bacterium]